MKKRSDVERIRRKEGWQEKAPQVINDVPNLCPWKVVQSVSQRLLLCRIPS